MFQAITYSSSMDFLGYYLI